MRKTAAIILAAGKGVRMKSSLPKALCELSGKPMVEFLIDAARNCGIKDIAVIGGYKIELLRKRLSLYDIKLIEQKKLLGSGDAVKQAKRLLKNFKGTVVVLYADTPLIKESTIKQMLKNHKSSKAAATLLTIKLPDAKEYGRILRDKKRKISAIIEKNGVSSIFEGRSGKSKTELTPFFEINVGAYCFDSKRLFEGLGNIKKNKKKKEYYLTDIAAYFYKKGYLISSYTTKDIDEVRGVNRPEELAAAEEILKARTISALLKKGVVIKSASTVFIEENVKIGKGTVIYPFVVIENGVTIGRDCSVGPFARLRSGTVLKNSVSIGNFVEINRSEIGEGSRAKHHSYLGDTIVGKRVNIGAGTITANYDGKNKARTIIDDEAFIGSGTTIVAPVKIGKRAVTGAGSVVVKRRNVAPNTIVAGVPARTLIKKRT